MKKICVIGLGKLGLPMACLYASKGYNVTGIDLDVSIKKICEAGLSPYYEPYLDELLSSSICNLHFLSEFPEQLDHDIFVIIVPTPSQDGIFDNSYVIEALKSIKTGISGIKKVQTIILASTVMPGSCDLFIRDYLSNIPNKNEENLGFIYSPEFIALGSVIHDLQNADLILIGGNNDYHRNIAESFYKTIILNKNSTFKKISLIDAELTKICINTYITTKITFANMIGEIALNTPGANAYEICEAVSTDTRIGKKYFSPGLGYAGPCFPRDNIALSLYGKSKGCKVDIPQATDNINNNNVIVIAQYIKKFNLKKVGLIGGSYKANTNVFDESQSLKIKCELERISIQADIIDFFDSDKIINLNNKILDIESYDGFIIMIHSEVFDELIDKIKNNKKIIIDPWGFKSKFTSYSLYYALYKN